MSINLLLPVTFSRLGCPAFRCSAIRCIYRVRHVMSSTTSTSEVTQVHCVHY